MKISVVGLGYVGLPLALAFARKFEGTVGFDINKRRIQTLKEGKDLSGETPDEEIASSTITFTDNHTDMKDSDFFIIGVPTPVDEYKNPDLSALRAASRSVAECMKKGCIVVYESTVYPGVTEEVCAPILEEVSGLKCGKDFKLGYTPERINPGDKKHTLENVIKVVSGQDEDALDRVCAIYEQVVTAGLHRASSIKVAEAAKVIENTQRDLNIALMNELAMIFDKMGISTHEVLEAAGTKWNFLPFVPGLVGGHCIGVDPYYLTTAAQRLGYHPEVILAGRRINDNTGRYVAQKMIKLLVDIDCPVKDSRIGILGVTFKENVADFRNSRVPDIVEELSEFGCKLFVYDPHVDPKMIKEEYGIELCDRSELRALDGVVLAVNHDQFVKDLPETLPGMMKKNAVLVDVKSIVDQKELAEGIRYWSL
jgi:UDP-N-acetyl-D-galactosamine dehydrogenase